MAYTAEEKALRADILKRLSDPTLSEQSKGALRSQLESLRETSLARAREKRRQHEERLAAANLPKRENFATESEWLEARELFRLGLTEKACHRKLDSPRTNLRARVEAEKLLERIAKRKAELQARMGPEAIPVSQTDLTQSPIRRPHQSKSVEDLFNSLGWAMGNFFPDAILAEEIKNELGCRGVDWAFWRQPNMLRFYPNRAEAENFLEESKKWNRETN
ncbi:MAG TPA: hypothetical protein VL913_00710 [Candidatus Micrarchaeaceae archaeon]|nr:hypothetical protein [Candidatus Micrarchaeaceae archaeon]